MTKSQRETDADISSIEASVVERLQSAARHDEFQLQVRELRWNYFAALFRRETASANVRYYSHTFPRESRQGALQRARAIAEHTRILNEKIPDVLAQLRELGEKYLAEDAAPAQNDLR